MRKEVKAVFSLTPQESEDMRDETFDKITNEQVQKVLDNTLAMFNE